MSIASDSVKKLRKGNGTGTMDNTTDDAAAFQNMAPSSQAEQIAIAAYLRAEQRGFAPGNELDDWLRAEAAHEAEPPYFTPSD